MVTTGGIGWSGMNTGIVNGSWWFIMAILGWESLWLPALGRQRSEGQLQRDWSPKVFWLIWKTAFSSNKKLYCIMHAPLPQYTCEFQYKVKKMHWLFVNRSNHHTILFLWYFFFRSNDNFFWLYYWNSQSIDCSLSAPLGLWEVAHFCYYCSIIVSSKFINIFWQIQAGISLARSQTFDLVYSFSICTICLWNAC